MRCRDVGLNIRNPDLGAAKALHRPLGSYVGSLQPASLMRYFHAVMAHSRRFSARSASVILGRRRDQAPAKAAQALWEMWCGAVLAFALVRDRSSRRTIPTDWLLIRKSRTQSVEQHVHYISFGAERR